MIILVMGLDLIEDQVFHFHFGQIVLIFGTDMNSSVHIDNKKKDMLVFGKRPTQGFEHTLTAETMNSINFTVTNKNFRWACITMEQTFICLSMVPKFTNLKEKVLKLQQLHYA